MITHSRLKELLDYDPMTGLFAWKISSGKRRAGAPVGWVDGGYIRLSVDGDTYKAHRLAWFYMTGEWPDGDTDHENGIRTDNRFANLRPATRSQNMMNTKLKSHNTSGYKGVSFWKKTGKWKAQIQVDKKKLFLGYHETPEGAYEAFIFAALEHHGEYARLA